MQLILNLRKAQRKEARKLSANAAVNQDIYRNKNVVNGGIIQPLILSAADKKDEKKDDKAKKKKEEDVQPDKV